MRTASCSKPELWVERLSAPTDIVRELLDEVPDSAGSAACSGMTRAASAKLRAYPVLAGLGLIGALVLGRPEFARLLRHVVVGAALQADHPVGLRAQVRSA